MTRVYYDHNATSPLRDVARAAMLAAFEAGGNASSVHAEGRTARRMVEEARETIALGLGVVSGGITFTAGATEAAATVLRPFGSFQRLIVGATEHVAVREGHGFTSEAVTTVGVDRHGRIDSEALEAASARAGWATVAIQAVNNETGVIQDIRALGRQVRAAGHLFVVDAVQAIGRIEVDPADADILILSGHKVGGPQGVGAIVATAEGFDGSPLIRGGGQERGRRAGTENVAGIAGFAAAFKAATGATSGEAQRLGALRDRFEAGLIELAPDVLIAGAGAERVGNTSCFGIPGVSAETALIAYDLEGIALSSGAACSSGRVRSSHVLSAMGVPADLVRGALRVSFGWTSTEADVERLLSVTARLLPRLRGSKARAA